MTINLNNSTNGHHKPKSGQKTRGKYDIIFIIIIIFCIYIFYARGKYDPSGEKKLSGDRIDKIIWNGYASYMSGMTKMKFRYKVIISSDTKPNSKSTN